MVVNSGMGHFTRIHHSPIFLETLGARLLLLLLLRLRRLWDSIGFNSLQGKSSNNGDRDTPRHSMHKAWRVSARRIIALQI